MIKKCAVCGKEFKANYGNCKICSDECRATRNKKLQKQWYIENCKYRTLTRGHNCQFCGKEVKPIKAIRTIRKKYHDECLMKAAYEAMKNGENFTKKSKFLTWVHNQGFTKAEILEFMEGEDERT